MTSLYVVGILQEKERYKVGIHTGSRKKLLSRYTTYYPDNFEIHYFTDYPRSKIVEQQFLNRYDTHRVVKSTTGRKSEWIRNVPLNVILKDLKRMVSNDKQACRRDQNRLTRSRMRNRIIGGVTFLSVLSLMAVGIGGYYYTYMMEPEPEPEHYSLYKYGYEVMATLAQLY